MKANNRSRFAAVVLVPALMTGTFAVTHLRASSTGCCGSSDCVLDYPYKGCDFGGTCKPGYFPTCCGPTDFCSC
jgi:hypothetical protein